ncbi:MAG TPA: LLM class flavin-dependent oxidoreductase [Mycobacterium sp.]|nr:LLM class flavin-dependent oxidoreductase [Mycobacterium sp.]
MKIGIGLPNALPGVDGPALLDWARRAEDLGFSTLSTIDRLVYDSYDPLTVLAAAAAVTTRITLATTVLLAPLHTNHVGFAKQAASLDRLAGGRLLLGLAPGPREDDFVAAGASFRRRGADLDRMLDRVTSIWRDPMAEIGPKPATPGGPPLLFGGFSPPAFRRVANHGTGWVSGVFGLAPFRAGAARAIDAWKAAGRDRAPRLLACASFALGPTAQADAHSHLRHYYRFLGPRADQAVAEALTTSSRLGDAVHEFEHAGCHELILFPCNPDPNQIDELCQALPGGKPVVAQSHYQIKFRDTPPSPDNDRSATQ